VKTSVPSVIVLSTAVLFAGCRVTSPPAGPQATPIAVSTATAASTTLASSFEAGGVVRARSTAVVSSRIMAPVVEVRVRAGDRVRRNAPLVILDSREIDANRARAAATLVSATESVRAAQADVRTAQAAVTLARTTHDRVRTLHEKRSATTQELDQAVTALETADGQLGQAQAHLAAASAARDAAQAASDAAAITTSYATLAAPFDGVVTERSVDPGSMASPGVGLLTVEDSSTFRLDVSLDEARAAHVHGGQAVDVNLGDGEFPATIAGHVSEVARIDPISHSFLVKIDLPPVADLRSGTYGRARFPGSSRQTLTVPAAAAIRRGQLTFVFTVDGERRARLQAVSPGVASGDRLEILAGLHEHDSVITDPPPSLSDGASVAGATR
jgi:RND family efflux transporter MFP subunit